MPELIILVGVQAAGKTTWYRKHFEATHVHVSKDLMKNTRDRDMRQRALVDEALGEGKSVVVDNTNPTPASRAPLIEIARRHGARVVGYFFDTPAKVAFARNRLREGKARVPDAAVFVTARRIVRPELAEGFDEVHVITAEAENRV